ncbi:hypothetical protein ACJJTC_008180 [Scirpophaga incertulas]
MFHTPKPKMVNTRSTVRREPEVVDLRSQQQSVPQKLEFDANKEDTPCAGMSGLPGSSVKCENLQQPPIKSFPAKSMSRRSSTSIVQARKKQLELEAAKQKAKIQMELIEKQLEADIAELNNDVYSSQHEDEPITRDVENWLEKSCQQSERFAPEMDIPAGDPCTFAQHHGQPLASRKDANSGDTVHLLATALKDLAANFRPIKMPRKLKASHSARIKRARDARVATVRTLASCSGRVTENNNYANASSI